MNTLKNIYTFSIALLFFTSISIHSNAAEIHISGSDWLDNVFNTTLDSLAESRGNTITWELKGSYPALKAIHTNQTDLALLALPDGTQDLDPSLKTIPLTYLAIVITVHRENPIESIKEAALRGIYSPGASTPISQWGDLELKSAWESLSISAYTIKESAHPLLKLFKHICLKTSSLKPGVQQWEHIDDLRNHLSNDTLSIATIPYFEALPQEKLKPLPIVLGENSIPMSPTLENIHNGEYPYRLPFYMVFKQENLEKLIPYCKALLDKNINPQLLRHSLTPLPEKVRQTESLRLDFKR